MCTSFHFLDLFPPQKTQKKWPPPQAPAARFVPLPLSPSPHLCITLCNHGYNSRCWTSTTLRPRRGRRSAPLCLTRKCCPLFLSSAITSGTRRPPSTSVGHFTNMPHTFILSNNWLLLYRQHQVDRVVAVKENALNKVRPVISAVVNRFEASERTGLRVATVATLITASHLLLPSRLCASFCSLFFLFASVLC